MSRYKAYPAYKDSGVEWVGEIPTSWHVTPLFSVASTGVEKNDDGAESNVLSLSYGRIIRRDVEDNHGLLPESFNTYQIVDLGDIILRLTDLQNDKRSLRVGMANEKGIITSAYLKLTAKAWFLDRYLYRLLHSYDTTKVFYGMGGGLRQSMKFEEMRRLQMLCPSLDEQKQIADFLDHETAKIDTLIEKQQRLIELLKEKRQAVISHAVTKGLNPNAPMKNSGVEWLGEVPAHWEVLPIKYLSDSIGTGGTPKSELSFTEELEISWFTPGDFSTHAKLISSTKHVTNRAVANGDAKVFRASSILVIGIGATLGKVALCESNFSCNQQINVVSPNSKVKAEFLVNSLQAQTEQMKQSSNFSTIGIMNQEKTKQLVIAVPPLDEQVAVAVFLDEKKMKFDAIESHAVNQIALLQERRTALISAAVTGKIDVRDWQPAAAQEEVGVEC